MVAVARFRGVWDQGFVAVRVVGAWVGVGAGRYAAGVSGGCGEGSDGGEPLVEQVGPGPAGWCS